MFDFLKKKITAFTDKVKEKLSGKAAEKAPEAVKAELPKPEAVKVEIPSAKPEPSKAEIPIPKSEAKIQIPAEKAIEKAQPKLGPIPEKPIEKIKSPKPAKKTIPPNSQIVATKPVIEAPEKEELPELKVDESRQLKAKVGVAKKLFGFISGEIKVEESDLKDFLEEFELSLLESDVEQDTASDIVKGIKQELVGKKIPRGTDITAFLKVEIKLILEKIMETNEVSIENLAKKKKPLIILFLGPNGAGKTTSIAKLTHRFQKQGKSVIWAAADTFRAASIEQLEEHGRRLGVRVVKHKYGADPAAVAFDAIKAAEASKADAVFIDSAGRQETNSNLMEELKKIVRVAKPDLKIYVGESYSGQALLQQATEFNSALSIDGFILTKIDADAKGGTAISLLHKLKKPIICIGTGQEYSDLVDFKPKYIVDRVLGR